MLAATNISENMQFAKYNSMPKFVDLQYLKYHFKPLFLCSPAELRKIVSEVKGQLKKLAITSSNRKDKVFLGINMARQGFVTRENIRELCQRQYLPSDDAVVDAVSVKSKTVNPC